MRKLTVTAAAVAALFVPFSGAVASAATPDPAQVAVVKAFGPFLTSTICKNQAAGAVKHGWKITQPCHQAVGSAYWYFKAAK